MGTYCIFLFDIYIYLFMRFVICSFLSHFRRLVISGHILILKTMSQLANATKPIKETHESVVPYLYQALAFPCHVSSLSP